MLCLQVAGSVALATGLAYTLEFPLAQGAARPWDVFQDPSASPIADPAKHLKHGNKKFFERICQPGNHINKGIEMEIEMRQHKYLTIDVIGTWANAKAFKLPALFLALLVYISCNHELSIAKP